MAKDIWTILRKRYPESEYALMQEVSDKAGHGRSRSADYMVMNLWPSRGLSLHGIELKSFRSDWLGELKNPKKAENIFQYCDYFWLLTSEESIAKLEEIPANWGWLSVKSSRIHVKKEAPKLSPLPITRSFLAAMLKRACDKTEFVHVDSIEDEINKAREENSINQERKMKDLVEELAQIKDSISKFQKASGIYNLSFSDRWSDGDPTKIGEAVKFLEKGGAKGIKEDLLRLEESAKRVLEGISAGIKTMDMEVIMKTE